MKKQEHRQWNKENYLRNGHKSQGQWSKNSLNTTIEQPGMNQSGKDAIEKGY